MRQIAHSEMDNRQVFNKEGVMASTVKLSNTIYYGLVMGGSASLVALFHREPLNYWTVTANAVFLWLLLFGKSVPTFRMVRIFVIASIVYSLSHHTHRFTEVVSSRPAVKIIRPMLRENLGRFYDETFMKSTVGQNLLNVVPEELAQFMDNRISLKPKRKKVFLKDPSEKDLVTLPPTPPIQPNSKGYLKKLRRPNGFRKLMHFAEALTWT